MTIRDNSGDSIYHALDLKLDRRFSHGLLLRTSYTFSKLIDDGSEVFTTTGSSSFPADLTLGHRFVDRGLSAFDRRHRIVVSYIYDIPKLKGDSDFAKGLGYITNGWQIAGTTAYQAGAPNTISDGFDANGDGQANDRPNIANPNAPITFWAIDSAQLGLPGGNLCDGPSALNLGTCKSTINGTTIAVNANNVLRKTEVIEMGERMLPRFFFRIFRNGHPLHRRRSWQIIKKSLNVRGWRSYEFTYSCSLKLSYRFINIPLFCRSV
jgi:hypothetical protein